jgi:hypothetical protein
MERTFDLSSVGRVNRFYAQDEASAIRSAMTQEEETLTQLIEKKKVIEEDLARFRIALAPHNLLPNEILSHIFFLAAQNQWNCQISHSLHKVPSPTRHILRMFPLEEGGTSYTRIMEQYAS